MEGRRQEWSDPPSTVAAEADGPLGGLGASVSSARTSQAQFAALFDAVVAISSDLDLPEVLERIVFAACRLVDARYGALGVTSGDGERLAEFVTYGVTPQERAAIGDPPRGHGVLGLLLTDPRPLRLKDIRAHEKSAGFPPNHPRMTTFLGVPVRIHDEVFGNLYLAEKHDGEEFTQADESMLVTLAAAAGVGIENARLYERAGRQAKWTAAVARFSRILLQSDDDGPALAALVEDVRTLSDASAVAVLLWDEGGIWLGASTSEGVLDGPLDPESWEPARLLREPTFIDHGESPSLWSGGARSVLDVDQDAQLLVVPAMVGDVRVGFLLIAWCRDPGRTGSADVGGAVMGDAVVRDALVLDALRDLARQTGLALAAAQGQRNRWTMALLEDRDRIARDMHDHVIQRLFATGLSLQSAMPLTIHPVVRERVLEAVDDLDTAIKDIRHTIFELHRTGTESGDMSDAVAELHAVTTDYLDALGFAPELTVEGRVDALDGDLRRDVVAVLREGLANAARHSHASRVRARVTVASHVTVEVQDDGVGLPPDALRSGLANLADRAGQRDGALEVVGHPGEGTTLTWRVPRPSS
ncbi:MAG: GAF domain-containing protein [Intrasporangium sp.]|uniref:GAF domain-containing sensor histidine kinase n=1 Tax=Intrasporangium sp. TaxID=1925024 RepID=UPI0026494874|nr:GAF domain-containing protein [Intrasporangium sp.]MDN5796805.1 GAF domain-containing protein [Intrasporangium sp.]